VNLTNHIKNRIPYAKTILMPTGSSSRNHISTANSTAITLIQNLLPFIVPLSIISCLVHLAKTKSRVTDSQPVESVTRLSLLLLSRGPVALRPHLSMGLPFRSQFLWLLMHFPKTKSRVTDSQPVESVTRLSLLLLSGGPVALRPHLSMGLPFRSQSLWLSRHELHQC
jgi:hypothetical protein